MNYKVWIVLWCMFAISVVYWDMKRWEEDVNPISKCHYAEILMYHNRPMCTECKMYCELVDGQREE